MVGSRRRWGNTMGHSNREYVGRALDILAASLAHTLSRFWRALAPGVAWPKILEHKDANAGRTRANYSAPGFERPAPDYDGGLRIPWLSFQPRPRRAQLHIQLRQTRNLWAHNEAFDDADTYRALDTAGRLAKHLELTAQRKSSAYSSISSRRARESVVMPEAAETDRWKRSSRSRRPTRRGRPQAPCSMPSASRSRQRSLSATPWCTTASSSCGRSRSPTRGLRSAAQSSASRSAPARARFQKTSSSTSTLPQARRWSWTMSTCTCPPPQCMSSTTNSQGECW